MILVKKHIDVFSLLGAVLLDRHDFIKSFITISPEWVLGQVASIGNLSGGFPRIKVLFRYLTKTPIQDVKVACYS